jgi:hypothetical protein
MKTYSFSILVSLWLTSWGPTSMGCVKDKTWKKKLDNIQSSTTSWIACKYLCNLKFTLGNKSIELFFSIQLTFKKKKFKQTWKLKSFQLIKETFKSFWNFRLDLEKFSIKPQSFQLRNYLNLNVWKQSSMSGLSFQNPIEGNLNS